MKSAFIVLFGLLITGVLAFPVSSSPQHGSGILTGLVLGPDDKPVPHAAVTYQSGDGSSPHATHTDARGRFTITKLRSDVYDLRASANGVFSEWQKNIAVHSGKTKSITLHLIYAKEMPKAYGATPAKP
jgi:hypothetical protein